MNRRDRMLDVIHARGFRPACQRKHPYPNRQEALRVAAKCSETVYVYKCPECRKWHLTSQEQE